MKNIHVLPTDKPTWLHKSLLSGTLRKSSSCIDDMKQSQGMNIYITSDEDIKKGEYGLSKLGEIIKFNSGYDYRYYYKIILTSDTELVKDGVQAIPDEFLEWFVKHSEVEFVEIQSRWLTFDLECWLSGLPSNERDLIGKTFDDKLLVYYKKNNFKELPIDSKIYRIILPIEKPIIKQETVEEAAENYSKITLNKQGLMSDKQINGFIAGAKWQAERMYSEEEVKKLLLSCKDQFCGGDLEDYHSDSEVIEWFKKRNKN